MTINEQLLGNFLEKWQLFEPLLRKFWATFWDILSNLWTGLVHVSQLDTFWLPSNKPRHQLRPDLFNRPFSRDVTKIGNEVGGHVGVQYCVTWLLNQLRIAYWKPLELAMNRSHSWSTENNLDSHVKERYMEKVSIIAIDTVLISEQKCNPKCLPLVGRRFALVPCFQQ